MRLCRYQSADRAAVALYLDDAVVPLERLAGVAGIKLPPSDDLLEFLAPDGPAAETATRLDETFRQLPEVDRQRLTVPVASVKLLVPVPRPPKVILLAGNYAEHIREHGGIAAERNETFPYFFMKPTSTLTHPGDAIRIPKLSPNHIDWEVELGVIIGRRCKDVSEADALKHVAGYTICNDISDRKFTLNLARKPRDRDRFFDWQHGKWHDTFLPMGPCVCAAVSLPDPQNLTLRLRVNGQTMQDGRTAQMIFPVAALVAILSSIMTLEPGDVISTGTPGGVGNARKPPIYLKSGDVVEAEIEGIGVLSNPVV